MQRLLSAALIAATMIVPASAQERSFTVTITHSQMQTVVDALQDAGPYRRVAPALHAIMQQLQAQAEQKSPQANADQSKPEPAKPADETNR